MSKELPKITKEEIETIKDAQAGSMKAFNHIFFRYKDFVDHVLYQYVQDLDEARDLTNEVFLKVYEKLSKFTRYESFGGWLRILAKNTVNGMQAGIVYGYIGQVEYIVRKMREELGDFKVIATGELSAS